ncbi:hypothetical protein H5410_026394 [Solanum commersonii]|uniref:Uncharacterized protein n=1 Tax=Solanum commersonii TaxID=4109 RepID=A0A9J5Z1E0_SOLCO|nr:hypothetical protein H5410_026394 [Solanum commersonii]
MFVVVFAEFFRDEVTFHLMVSELIIFAQDMQHYYESTVSTRDRLHKFGSRLDKRIPDLVGMEAAIRMGYVSDNDDLPKLKSYFTPQQQDDLVHID